ncbi:hypothetical protein ACWD4V_16240 [Streptomyces tsukubensis]
MKVTPRASFVIGVDSGLTDQKAEEVAQVLMTLTKSMTEAPVHISFQRHFRYQDKRVENPFSSF